jgi:UDPglucose 6-dehydrogenase
MRISVVGTGYVGLVSGVCLAESGHQVICVDVDPRKVARINGGDPPIYEPGLEELLKGNIGHRLRATTDLRDAVLATDVTMIAVGTPFDGNAIDLSQVRTAALEIGRAIGEKDDYHVVIVKSTVVPGTTDDLVLPMLELGSGKRAGADFGVGMNPEFLREGEAIADFLEPDRIVMGGVDDRTHDAQAELYAPFAGVDVLRTSNRTAEMIKYTANSLLATLISFSNEIGNLCSRLGGIDVTEVMAGVHLDRRFSPILEDGRRITPGSTTYLQAGCGFGGSCFPKDVKALVAHGRQAGLSMEILDSVIRVNQRQPGEVLRLLEKHFPDLSGVQITVLGLAFKPGTDDMRESPSIPVVEALRERGAIVRAYDPVARLEAERYFGGNGISFSPTLVSAVIDADAVILMTRWPEFVQLDTILEEHGQAPVVIDGRRMLDRRRFLHYEGIGLSANSA